MKQYKVSDRNTWLGSNAVARTESLIVYTHTLSTVKIIINSFTHCFTHYTTRQSEKVANNGVRLTIDFA